MFSNENMKLFHVNVNTQGMDAWLAGELINALSKLPEFGEQISTESLVLSRNPGDARTRMHNEIMRSIAKHQLIDPETIRQLSTALDAEGIIVVESISMTDPRVVFLNCSVPLANAA